MTLQLVAPTSQWQDQPFSAPTLQRMYPVKSDDGLNNWGWSSIGPPEGAVETDEVTGNSYVDEAETVGRNVYSFSGDGVHNLVIFA